MAGFHVADAGVFADFVIFCPRHGQNLADSLTALPETLLLVFCFGTPPKDEHHPPRTACKKQRQASDV
jgi:hypothetical protein